MLLAAFGTSEDVGRKLSRLFHFSFHHALAQRLGNVAQNYCQRLVRHAGSGRFDGLARLAQPLSVRHAAD
jgi:hypothetical protein